jgi:hypothetical protein
MKLSEFIKIGMILEEIKKQSLILTVIVRIQLKIDVVGKKTQYTFVSDEKITGPTRRVGDGIIDITMQCEHVNILMKNLITVGKIAEDAGDTILDINCVRSSCRYIKKAIGKPSDSAARKGRSSDGAPTNEDLFSDIADDVSSFSVNSAEAKLHEIERDFNRKIDGIVEVIRQEREAQRTAVSFQNKILIGSLLLFSIFIYYRK